MEHVGFSCYAALAGRGFVHRYAELAEVFGKCVQSTLHCHENQISDVLLSLFRMVDSSKSGALSYAEFKAAVPKNGKSLCCSWFCLWCAN